MDGVLEVERGGMVSLASDVWSPSYMVLEVLTGTPPWSELGGTCEVGVLLLLVASRRAIQQRQGGDSAEKRKIRKKSMRYGCRKPRATIAIHPANLVT